MLVKDTAEIGYGVVSTDNKILIPCNNYGVAIGDIEAATFFVKRDTPLINRYDKEKTSFRDINLKEINLNELNEEDKDWLMYNNEGKLLDNTPFRCPTDFKKGVGIGVQGDYFNLYKTDGTILKPFKKDININKSSENSKNTEGGIKGYKNIRRAPNLGFYTLFYRQGLTPMVVLTKDNGEILVENNRYDGISEFYGQYALVSDGKKIGLIDTLGREIIAPQDLRTYKGHFMDSLDLYNKLKREEYFKRSKNTYLKEIKLPISIHKDNTTRYIHPDSLKITAFQRAALWNLMLEQWTSIQTINDFMIPQVSHKANASFFYGTHKNAKIDCKIPKKISIGDSTLSFVLTQEPYILNLEKEFHNFYYKNNRWEALQINDLLHIQGENRWLLNDLMIKKIKALKDAQIDCSNTSAFVTTVENRFMLTTEGIDFCFNSTGSREEFVIISFTWGELKPFLKLKIGGK